LLVALSLVGSVAASYLPLPGSDPVHRLLGVHPAGADCFAYGVNGSPNGTAPTSVCNQCAATHTCAATDGHSFWCGQCTGSAPPPPPPVPDKPGIDAGPACLGGPNRTVTLIPGNNSSNATYQVQISPGGTTLSGQTVTFPNLQQGVGYTFTAQATN